MELISFMFMAFFVEGLVDFVKQIVDADKSIKYAYILSIVLAILLFSFCIVLFKFS